MADISKCVGLGCPIKDICYRNTAPKGMFQSWFMSPPFEMIEDVFHCEMYWPTGNAGYKEYREGKIPWVGKRIQALKEVFKDSSFHTAEKRGIDKETYIVELMVIESNIYDKFIKDEREKEKQRDK